VTESASLARLAESYLDLRWHLDPVEASGAGVTLHDERLGSFGDDRVREHLAGLRALHGALEELALDDLEDEIDRTALLNDARVLIHRYGKEAPHRRDPGFWVSHALEGLYQMLIARDRPAAHRATAALRRLEALPAFLDEARATLAADCPRVFVQTGAEVARTGGSLVAEIEQAYASADGVLEAAATAARAALERFAGELEALAERAPAAGYAVGEQALNFRLSYQHALRSTAVEALRYGRRLVEEVEAELAATARRLTPGAPSWLDVAHRLRDEHPPAADLVGAYAAAMERARRFVEERGLVSLPPGALEVTGTPAYLRPLIPLAAYLPPGAFSSDRTGRFFVSPPQGSDDGSSARDHCVYEIPATALHEGYPGHHLHFLTAQASPRTVRRLLYSPATVEGWALYCEDMMGVEGFYRSEEERFFQRTALLWRALRIVLDVGLHTGTLPYDEAVRMVRARMGYSAAHAESEVRRACAEPAYQLAYAMGRRELLALQEAYARAAGAGYTLRGFHDAVLRYGGLPVSLMRWGMGLDG
jgi:uncharacterized protein (DUF885 family)